MWIAHMMCVLVFGILGIVFFKGKGASLIAGYNTVSKYEKAKYDQTALCKFMGKIMFVLAACFVVMAVSDWTDIMALLWIGLGLVLAVAVFAAIYANTGNRFKK